METPPPPCLWTKPQCRRRPTDESKDDNGEATPAPPSQAATEVDITIPELPEIADGFGWYKKYHIVGKPDENPWQSSRQEIPGIRYGGLGNLRKATITGFCTAKSLVELTWHILERASSSLQCLVLDASPGYDRKRSSSDRCLPMRTEALRDAQKRSSA
ncbi:uncharacterized protein [Miscanthus floridulus]|uniref:uncharacterized protein isoform X2 n=1 Tax=Miscanthus floridulus TaxID=154761 RepID=UPI00345A0579